MTFECRPGAPGTVARGQRAHRRRTRCRNGKQVRVLVVDDEPSICKAMAIALSRAGFDPSRRRAASPRWPSFATNMST